MSIWNRMRDITVATLNDRLEQSEDPVRLIDGYLTSLREQIRESERLFTQCASHVQAVRQQYLSARQMKEKREEQALLALQAGEDEIARLALQDKLLQEDKCSQYGPLYEEGQQTLADLEQQLRQMKSDFDEVAARRSYYQARMESIRLQRRLNERVSGIGGNLAPRAFQRLDERISDMELESRTLRDVRRSTSDYSTSGFGSGIPSGKLEYEMNKLRLKLEDKRDKLEEKLDEKRIKLEEKLDEKLSKLNGVYNSDQTS
ncbi:MAG: PspA/IM30 family protein [Gorillibacterium sp.]|nr:PspA/IM30 family protein [Gorillibacterium sp.]